MIHDVTLWVKDRDQYSDDVMLRGGIGDQTGRGYSPTRNSSSLLASALNLWQREFDVS